MSDGPTLEARVYGPDQEPLANADVTLTTTSGSAVGTLRAVPSLGGTATFTGAVLPVAAEYIAAACGVESNAIELSPLG